MLPVYSGAVTPDFVDYNDHMNDAAYALVFSRSADGFFAAAGLDAVGRARTGQTIYTLALLIHYKREAQLGTGLAVTARLLEHDAKRVRLWLEMTHAETGQLLATCEQVLICMRPGDDGAKVASFAPDIAVWLDAASRADAAVPWPAEAGHGITLKRK